jgi:hypothetical protein
MAIRMSTHFRGALSGALAGLMTLGLFAASACNSVTGAGDIRLTQMGESDEPSAGNDGNGGNGGNASQPGDVGAGDPGGGLGPGHGSGGDDMGEPPPPPCDYPTGPYGVGTGQTVPPDLAWQGYAPGSDTPTTVSIQDFFDCDGLKGIDAVLIDTSQFG